MAQRLVSIAISASQPYQVTTITPMKTLSQNTWPFWNGPLIRSLSRPGSIRASHNTDTRLPRSISATKIQPPGQSIVPAAPNRSAPMNAIHAMALAVLAQVTKVLRSAGQGRLIC